MKSAFKHKYFQMFFFNRLKWTIFVLNWFITTLSFVARIASSDFFKVYIRIATANKLANFLSLSVGDCSSNSRLAAIENNHKIPEQVTG